MLTRCTKCGASMDMKRNYIKGHENYCLSALEEEYVSAMRRGASRHLLESLGETQRNFILLIETLLDKGMEDV